MRLTVGLRSPLVFQLPGAKPLERLKAPLDTVGISFEERKFVWHPPIEREDELGRNQYGPMVAVLYADDEDAAAAARALQRFLSASAFVYDQPVDDAGSGGLGGDGESDAYDPFGARTQRSHSSNYVAEAPAGLVVADDPVLRIALAYYQEGLNAASPFYRCLTFRNVLDAVFEVEHETKNNLPTAQAAARDAFIDTTATPASFGSKPPLPEGWAEYLREQVRNALAHVKRTGRREVDPDHPAERIRLMEDAFIIQRLARRAVERRWTPAVRRIPRHDA